MPEPFPEERRLAAEYRTGLGLLGFSDDGFCLQGAITWTDAGGQPHHEVVEITFDGGFPYAPPIVRPVADTTSRSLHQERNGRLCLYEGNELAGTGAPWRNPADLLAKVREWFEQSAAGWPGDEDVDLERYLPQAEGLVVYDSDDLDTKTGLVGLRRVRQSPAITRVTWQAPHTSHSASRKRGNKRRGRRQLRSKRPYGWLADIGEINKPILAWPDVASVLADQANLRVRDIRFAGLQLLMLRYSRASGNTGYLALQVQPRTAAPGGIEIIAQEAADEAASARNLRSGDQADSLKNLPVAVVGCGAVGSHIADLLLRAGVRRLRLMDPQLLRPGNCIRHLAGPEYVGHDKAHATAAVLQRNGADAAAVKVLPGRISSLSEAQELFSQVQLVIDATADNRATALLAAAATEAGKPLLAAALMRQGGIAVVDRVGEPNHGLALPTPANLPGAPGDLRERGCGDDVSRTPPHCAVAAATLVTRLAIDELSGRFVPTSTFEVLEPQPDAPFTERKVITS